jgi:hypothetical protein
MLPARGIKVQGITFRRAFFLLALTAIAPRLHAVITITEIMYHPQEGGPQEGGPQGGGRDLEYVEIHNELGDPMDITGYSFSNGISFTFTERTFLDPGAYLVVCANKEMIKQKYGIENVAGDWDPSTSLDNAGEAIELSNPAGVVEARVRYNDRGKWPSGADGTGHSLELRYVYSEMDDPDSWALSGALGGSPGKPNDTTSGALPVVINEALLVVNSGERWVELYNTGGTDVDLSGYHLTTNRADLKKGTLPAGTVLSARKWASFNEAELGLDFKPDATGRTFIALASPEGNRVIDARIFEPRFEGRSEARIPDGDASFSEAALPTRNEANRTGAIEDVVLNEIMYHPLDKDPKDEYVELYNRGSQPVDLTGWSFTDGIRFELPSGTVIAPDAYLVVAREPEHIREVYGLPPGQVLGPDEKGREKFGILSDQGERVTLTDKLGNAADTVRYFEGGEWSHWADGGGSSLELIDPFQQNAAAQAWDASDDSAKSPVKEYSYTGVYTAGEPELHLLLTGSGITLVDNVKVATTVSSLDNPTAHVDWKEVWRYFKGTLEPSEPITAWRQVDFDDSTWLSGGAILGFGDLDEATVLDDMQGNYISFYVRKDFQLSNPRAVENLVLEVEYDDGYVAYLNGTEVASGNMPAGRSFDTKAIASKEKAKEQIDLTGKKDLLLSGKNVVAFQVHNQTITGNDARFQARLSSGRLVSTEGPNLVKDGLFETDAYKANWTIQGTHVRSGRTAQDPLDGAGSLKIVSTGAGDNKVNRIETSNAGFAAPTPRTPYRVSFLAKWVVGSPSLLTHGAYQPSTPAAIASSTRLEVPQRLGTPGAINSVTARQIAQTGSRNLGPVISKVGQSPALPAGNVPVQVHARVEDPDGVSSVTLNYSFDTPRPPGDAGLLSLPMEDPDGDGIYTAEIPGQALKKRVVYHIVAIDSKGQQGRFPIDFASRSHPLLLDAKSATINDALYGVYRHDNPFNGKPQSYRFWLHQANEQYLSTRPLFSNDLVDGSFVFQNRDMYYNSKIHFSGSPFARQAWGESYRVVLPKDNPLHGSIRRFNMEDHQGVGAKDGRERISHYMIRYNQGQSKVPYSLQWLVQWQANDKVNEVREHVQTPNGDFISRWWPGDDTGTFFEMDDRHFFNDSGTRNDSQDGRLLYPPYGSQTLGPDKEQYRYYFNLRSNEAQDDYSELIKLAKLMTQGVTPNDQFDQAIFDEVDVEAFCRVWAIRLNTDDWDQWGGNRGKNCYLYRPQKAGRWYLLPWDMELTYGDTGSFLPPTLTATANPAYGNSFQEVGRLLNRPRVKRVFYGVMREMIEHQFQSKFLLPYMQRLDAIGVQTTNVGKPGGYVDQRRNRILNLVKGVSSPAIDFVVTTNDGKPLEVEDPNVTIEGKAPVEISLIAVTVNGRDDIPFEARFSDSQVLGWSASGTLAAGRNTLDLVGFNSYGDVVDSTSFEVTVVTPGPPAVDSISPSSVVAGETVIIQGSRFRQGLKVLFGDLEAGSVVFDSSRVEAVVPSGLALGDVSVVVQNPDGMRSEPRPLRVVAEKRSFVRGDADLSGVLNLTDAIITLRYLFQGGLAPTCLESADTNDDGAINLTDPLVALRFLFQGQASPSAPYPEVGQDPTPDSLGCQVGLE